VYLGIAIMTLYTVRITGPDSFYNDEEPIKTQMRIVRYRRKVYRLALTSTVIATIALILLIIFEITGVNLPF
jgi:hypothetical protein